MRLGRSAWRTRCWNGRKRNLQSWPCSRMYASAAPSAKTSRDTKIAAGHHLDGVAIELTGVADPAPVVQTSNMNKEVHQTFCVDTVAALVDAEHAIERPDESTGSPEDKDTACAQIASATTVLLKKIDLADAARLSDVESRTWQLNSMAEVIRCHNAAVPVHKLFNVGTFDDVSKVLQEAAPFLDFKASEEDFGSRWMAPKMDRLVYKRWHLLSRWCDPSRRHVDGEKALDPNPSDQGAAVRCGEQPQICVSKHPHFEEPGIHSALAER
uniref:CobW/HypB/UreG nucleotide-binding domain-containing protein n=1 Tax=Eutreptiella gymnastica TaxID=73025 RepID=A0A7S4CR58_9EUGL